MIIRPKDAEDRKYVMMNGVNGHYIYRGWVFGYEAKNEEWFRTAGQYDKRPPCYWVPLSVMRSEQLQSTVISVTEQHKEELTSEMQAAKNLGLI